METKQEDYGEKLKKYLKENQQQKNQKMVVIKKEKPNKENIQFQEKENK